MNVKQRIEQDLKSAMLAGDKTLVTTLRGLKGTILNVEIAEGKRDTGLTDEEVVALLQKESKRRQESIELYTKGGSQERAQAEQQEKDIIAQYLPKPLTEAEIEQAVNDVIAQNNATDMKEMGQIIGMVKQQLGASADGVVIARLVKAKLT